MKSLIKSGLITSLFICFVFFSASGQQNNVWVFGFRGPMELDFNVGSPPAPIALPYVPLLSFSTGYIANYYSGSQASVCDDNGQLLFYTDGSFVRDRNNNFMTNGTDLTGLYYPEGLAWDSDVTTQSQGALIVPMPDSSNKYYIFSLTSNMAGGGPVGGRLFYSIVDMNLNNGLGAVVPGRKGIPIDSNFEYNIAGVVGDHCDVWVILRTTMSQYKAYEISGSSINLAPVISPTGGPSIINSYQDGTMCFSPNRKKMAIAHYGHNGIIEVYDFDGTTGMLSNRIALDSGTHQDMHYYGVCFSPDNSKLYASDNDATDTLYQFDLSSGSAESIYNSRIAIGQCDWSGIRLGPDNKMYLISYTGFENVDTNNNEYGVLIGVVNQPNVYGAGCQYNPNALPQTDSIFHLNPLGYPLYDTGIYYDCPGCTLGNIAPIFHRDTTGTYQRLSTSCFATSYVIHANDSGWDYHWDNDTSIQTYLTTDSTGSYVVHYFTAPCTYHSDTFYVYFSSPLPSTGSLSGCPGLRNGKAWVLPHTGDTTAYTYTWTDNFGETLQPSVTSSVIADTLYNQYAGTYYISISGDNGCDTTLSVVIAPPDDSGFLHISDTGMCPHDTISIHVTGGTSYHWYVDSNTYISDTSSANPMVSPPTDWTYTVYGKNASGCLDTATAKVLVYPGAVIQLPDSIVLYYGESYRFNPGTNCVTFNWFPPQGLSADDISNPVASPQANTQYIVTGTTEEGCIIKEIVDVYRDDDVLLTLPNAFSPGNDPNNLLKPIYKGDIMLDYLRIFNRWGQLVYESSNLEEAWDGTWHGTPQPEGVYVYTMEGHIADGRVLSKQGNITLIR